MARPVASVVTSNTRAGAQLDAVGDRRRPIGHVGRGLGLHAAAKAVGAAVVAGRPAAVGHRIDVGVRRPPVPAEAVEAARQPLAVRPERQRRHGPRRARRIGGIAGGARAAHPLVVEIVVGLQVGVRQGPVVGDAVLAADPEVGGWKRGACAVQWTVLPPTALNISGVTSDSAVVDRIIFRQRPHVGIEAEAGGAAELPVGEGRRILAGLLPAALLEADDAETGVGQTARPPQRPRRRRR